MSRPPHVPPEPHAPRVPTWRRYLRFWRPDVAADVEDELQFHFDARTTALRARGLGADEAMRVAREEFGDLDATRRDLRAIGERLEHRRERARWWHLVRSDLGFTLRGLRATPLFTAGVVVTIALGVGAATVMYGTMRRLLLDPPPHVTAPERVALLYFHYQSPGDSARTWNRLSYPFYEQLRAHARTLDAVAAYAPGEPLVVGNGPDARIAAATLVSAGFWRVLGARPLLGRFFADDETHPVTGARVVVLGHAFWMRRYGGDPTVLGATLRVKGQPYRIVGVAPRGFRGMELTDTDVWLPLFARGDGARRGHLWHVASGSSNLALAVRRRPDRLPTRVEAELSREYARFNTTNDLLEQAGARTHVTLGALTGALDQQGHRRPEATVTVWLVGVAAVLLAVACANVASLLLLRALRRRREIAVRLALGMSRRRLAALLFVESVTLALMGGAAAAGVVSFGGDWVRHALLPGLLGESASVDWRVHGVAATAVVLTALLTGLAPVLQTRGDVVGGLRDGGQHGATRRSMTYATLLVSQTALSAVLLVGAGLFLRSLHRVTTKDLGLDTERTLMARVDFSGTGRARRDVAAFYERALERVRAMPGVEHASLATAAPLQSASGIGVGVHPRSSIESERAGVPMGAWVADDYFNAVGMHIVQGRGFVAADRTGPPVLVVNEEVARLGWPGRPPIGECGYIGDTTCARIVGVVRNAHTFAIREEQYLAAYLPLDPLGDEDRVLLVRATPGAQGMAATLGKAVRDLDPALPYVDVQRLGDALDPQLRPWRLGAAAFTAFGVLAALLAALGLYTATAYAVTQRTREIGVRVALGARTSLVLRLVFGDALRLTGAGIGAGLVAALIAGRWIAPLLFDTSPRDPAVLAAVGGSLLVVALTASLGPARRAAGVEPTVALRADA